MAEQYNSRSINILNDQITQLNQRINYLMTENSQFAEKIKVLESDCSRFKTEDTVNKMQINDLKKSLNLKEQQYKFACSDLMVSKRQHDEKYIELLNKFNDETSLAQKLNQQVKDLTSRFKQQQESNDQEKLELRRKVESVEKNRIKEQTHLNNEFIIKLDKNQEHIVEHIKTINLLREEVQQLKQNILYKDQTIIQLKMASENNKDNFLQKQQKLQLKIDDVQNQYDELNTLMNSTEYQEALQLLQQSQNRQHVDKESILSQLKQEQVLMIQQISDLKYDKEQLQKQLHEMQSINSTLIKQRQEAEKKIQELNIFVKNLESMQINEVQDTGSLNSKFIQQQSRILQLETDLSTQKNSSKILNKKVDEQQQIVSFILHKVKFYQAILNKENASKSTNDGLSVTINSSQYNQSVQQLDANQLQVKCDFLEAKLLKQNELVILLQESLQIENLTRKTFMQNLQKEKSRLKLQSK